MCVHIGRLKYLIGIKKTTLNAYHEFDFTVSETRTALGPVVEHGEPRDIVGQHYARGDRIIISRHVLRVFFQLERRPVVQHAFQHLAAVGVRVERPVVLVKRHAETRHDFLADRVPAERTRGKNENVTSTVVVGSREAVRVGK